MPISRYPRVGHIIAPNALRDVLSIPLPNWARNNEITMLSELDGKAWFVFSPEQCERLGSLVISQVIKNLNSCNKSFIIGVPSKLKRTLMTELELEVGTSSSLSRVGFDNKIGQFDGVSIEELLAIHDFGPENLVDLLSSLESVGIIVMKSVGYEIMFLTISKYPRYGHPISPQILRDILMNSLPSWAKKGGKEFFYQLDSSSWDVFSSGECARLGDYIVNQIGSLTALPSEILTREIEISTNMSNADTYSENLEMEVRTYNCLRRQGIKSLLDLNRMPIGELIQIRNFGVKSLVDLLTSLEAFEEKLRAYPSGSDVGLLNGIINSDGVLCANLTRQAEITMRKRYLREMSLNDIRFPFSNSLPRYGASTLGGLCSKLLERQLDPVHPELLAKEIKRIRLDAIRAEKLSLEDELKAVAEARLQRSDVVMDFLGWDGSGKKTLEAVGVKHGITRERVRQICSEARKVLEDTNAYTPVYDKAIIETSKMLPAMSNDVLSRLQELGICRGNFNISGILNAGGVLGKSVDIRTESVYGHDILIGQSGVNTKRIFKIVKKANSSAGACCFVDIQMSLADEGIAEDEDLLLKLISLMPSFSWLDEDMGWFWLNTGGRNPLANSIRKILCVTDSIDISELREGVGRHYRKAGFSPPRRVLLAFCQQIGFIVNGDRVSSNGTIDRDTELGDVEREMVRILENNGYVMARADYEELCLRSGINRSTFYVYLGNSPVIEKFAVGVYGLRGHDISPGVIAELAAKRPKRRVGKTLLDRGWTKDGKLWLAFNMTEGMMRSGTYAIPAAVYEYLDKGFDLYTDEDRHIGYLKCSGQSGYGLGPAIRRLGVEDGDCLILRYDLKKFIATIFIGGHELLLEYQEL